MTRIIVIASLVAVLGGALVGILAALWLPWASLAALVLLAAAAVMIAVRVDRSLRHEERSARIVPLGGRWHEVAALEPVPGPAQAPAAGMTTPPRIDLHPAAEVGDAHLALRRGA